MEAGLTGVENACLAIGGSGPCICRIVNCLCMGGERSLSVRYLLGIYTLAGPRKIRKALAPKLGILAGSCLGLEFIYHYCMDHEGEE